MIKDFLAKREKNKLAEKMAERFADVLMGDLQRQRRQQYEQQLKKDQDDLERRLKETERQQKKERERQKKIEEIRSMNLQTAKIADIKIKMDDLKIRHVGAITREDLIQQIKKAIPSISHTKVKRSI